MFFKIFDFLDFKHLKIHCWNVSCLYGLYLGPWRVTLNHLGRILRLSWGVLCLFGASPGVSWGVLSVSWGVLERLGRLLERSCGILSLIHI